MSLSPTGVSEGHFVSTFACRSSLVISPSPFTLHSSKAYATGAMSDDKAYYDDRDLEQRRFSPTHDLGAPGTFPYTRGPQASMYRGKLWTMRQYAGFSTAAESNARYRYLLGRGTTGLSVAFGLPPQIGMDSDATLARGEVGKVGVAIDTIEDMETLLDGIPLDKVSISMTINSPASI